MAQETLVSGEVRQVTRAAALISIGNVSSRALGLLREMAKSYFFGAGGAVSAFDVAAQVPTMLYDLLVGGMLSSALVPVFSDYMHPERRWELWQLVSLLLSLLTLSLGALVLLIEIAAPVVARLLGAGLDATYLVLATQMIRITTPAILFLNVAGLLSGVLYVQQRFKRPAFLGAVSNATLVIVVVLLGRSALGARSLAVGLLVGSLVQVLFQLGALEYTRLRFVLPRLNHPALRTIGALYLPIGLGLIVDQLAVGLSFNLASRIGPSGIAWMKYAATVIQFPLGMVVTAISIAILPTLSRYANEAKDARFRATLAQGLRLVLLLILPAATLMLVLAEPLVALLFQRGNFMAQDTQAVALALRFNLPGLIFAALDQLLIFAFYARKDTWTPAMVGVLTTAVYALLAFLPTLFGRLTLSLLILANSLKLGVHALFMFSRFVRRVGSLHRYGLVPTATRALGASAAMIPFVLLGSWGARQLGWTGLEGVLLEVSTASGLGILVYLGLLRHMGLEELKFLQKAVVRRLNRKEDLSEENDSR
ncbi:MAG: murein biosynthesis integral membrane protein MurJ [Anaerolineae bacterium]